MEAALASRAPLEVLDGVDDEDLLAVDPGFAESSVEELSCWSRERLADDVLAIGRIWRRRLVVSMGEAYPGPRDGRADVPAPCVSSARHR
jgi:hypothetical protein